MVWLREQFCLENAEEAHRVESIPFFFAQCQQLLFLRQSPLAHFLQTGTFYFALLGTSHIAATGQVLRRASAVINS
jgi:hypothetical protein